MVNYHDDFGGVEVQEKIEEAFVALRNVIRACGLEELHNDVNLVWRPSDKLMEYMWNHGNKIVITSKIINIHGQ